MLKPIAICLLSSLAARSFAQSPAAPEEARPRAIRWAKSFAEARETAAKGQRPLMVDFGAEWCGFCKKLDRETFSEENVIRLVSESFVAVKVDTDKEPDLAKKYEIGGLPTVVFLSSSGEVLARLEGFRPPDTFLKEARKPAESSASLQKMKELALKDPADIAAQRTYARALFATGNFDGALKVLEAARSALPKDTVDANLLLDLGDTYNSAGKKAEARAAYGQVLALKPEAAGEARDKAFLPLASVLLELKDANAALGVLDNLLKDPQKKGKERLQALLLRGYVHAQRKDSEKALADLKQVRDSDPEGRWGQRASAIIDTVESTK